MAATPTPLLRARLEERMTSEMMRYDAAESGPSDGGPSASTTGRTTTPQATKSRIQIGRRAPARHPPCRPSLSGEASPIQSDGGRLASDVLSACLARPIRHPWHTTGDHRTARHRSRAPRCIPPALPIHLTLFARHHTPYSMRLHSGRPSVRSVKHSRPSIRSVKHICLAGALLLGLTGCYTTTSLYNDIHAPGGSDYSNANSAVSLLKSLDTEKGRVEYCRLLGEFIVPQPSGPRDVVEYAGALEAAARQGLSFNSCRTESVYNEDWTEARMSFAPTVRKAYAAATVHPRAVLALDKMLASLEPYLGDPGFFENGEKLLLEEIRAEGMSSGISHLNRQSAESRVKILVAGGVRFANREGPSRYPIVTAAVRLASPELVRMLTRAGANPNEISEDGELPLDVALQLGRSGNGELISALTAAGAEGGDELGVDADRVRKNLAAEREFRREQSEVLTAQINENNREVRRVLEHRREQARVEEAQRSEEERERFRQHLQNLSREMAGSAAPLPPADAAPLAPNAGSSHIAAPVTGGINIDNRYMDCLRACRTVMGQEEDRCPAYKKPPPDAVGWRALRVNAERGRCIQSAIDRYGACAKVCGEKFPPERDDGPPTGSVAK